MKVVASLVLLLVFSVGCSDWSRMWSSSQSPFAPLSVQEASVKLNYSYVQSNVLIPYCIRCHGDSGGVNLESIESIRQNAQKIMDSLSPGAQKAMPRGPEGAKMSNSEKQILYDWLNAGAPTGTGQVQSAITTYPPLTDDEARAKLNFTYVRDNILISKCVSCHGNAGHVDLTDINSIQQNTRKILIAVLGATPTMPPIKTPQAFRILSEDDRQVMYNWLIKGAPAGDDIVPLPAIQPTYDDISKRIFQVRCMDCHVPGTKTGDKVPLTKEGLIAANGNGEQLVVPPGTGPVDPAYPQGILMLSLDQDSDDIDPMPIARRGYSKLPQEELDIIKLWILNGAKD